MPIIKRLFSLSHTALCAWLALYLGLGLNVAVFIRRFDLTMPFSQMAAEIIACVGLSFLLLRLASLGGCLGFRLLASALLLFSVAASYYMSWFNVIIGYGIIVATLTTDIDLSKEAVGYGFFLWLFALASPPLWLIWRSTLPDTLLAQLTKRKSGLTALALLLGVALLVWLPMRYFNDQQTLTQQQKGMDLASYGGIVAHSYVPSNWLASLGMYAYAKTDERAENQLFDPAKKFNYQAPADIDSTYVVFIIGETARGDRMSLLGFERETTPLLAKEANLIALNGRSCDTSTKLSLRCMFVRPNGVKNNPQRTVTEKNIFRVLKEQGFSSELFAMQSEVWFYNSLGANDMVFREMLAAKDSNKNKTVDDMVLIPEVQNTLLRYPKGKHLIVLHTKGSHYLYTMRYPRSFARYQPECMGIDAACSKTQLLNSFDNSLLYTDFFIKNVIDQLRDKNAIIFYASDHGESIDDNTHFHATPREVAPPEQFNIPMLVWASDRFLKNPQKQQAFQQLRAKAATGAIRSHQELYDSILGCLGYSSPNGGINPQYNWCAKSQ